MARPTLILGMGAAGMLMLAGIALWLDRPLETGLVTIAADHKIDVTPGTIYSARFTDTNGNEQEFGQWQKKLLVINFWATWCAPCKEEMPMLANIQRKFQDKGLQIVGIAVDSRENVLKFSENMTTGYPLFPDEVRAIEFSKRLGNRLGLLPYTVAVQPGGAVVFAKMGIVHEQELIQLVRDYGVK